MSTKLLAGLALCLLAITGLKAQVNLRSGLLAYYPMDGNAGDASGNGFNGTVVGAVPAPDRHGVANKAYSLGNGSKIIANITSIPLGATDRTVCAWVKWKGTSFLNAAHVANWGTTDSGRLFGVGIFKNNEWYTFGFNDSAGFDLASGVVADSLQWHSIVGSYEAGIMKVYVDGVLKASRAKTLNTIFTYLFIGNRPDEPSDSYFTGVVDDVMVYNRALNQAEITAIYNGSQPAVGVGTVKENNLDCHVYPNPAKDVLQIRNAKAGYVVHIFDMTGRMVLQQTLTGNELNISALPANANYLVRISWKGQQQTEQFTKL